MKYTWNMKKNQLYPTHLTDHQWHCIKESIPPAKPGGSFVTSRTTYTRYFAPGDSLRSSTPYMMIKCV